MTTPAPDPRHRRNNFDALRLIAAVSVVFSHSFLIAEGSEANEPFIWLTGNQCILGLVGVFVFFVISGYLVTESWCRSPMPGRFALRRFLRIYPGLIVNVALCAFVLGPLVTSLPLAAYFHGPELRDFLGKTLTLNPGPLSLPGVLFADNPVGLHINGSLWTLRYEAMMYLMIVILGRLRLLRLSTCLALTALGIAAVYFEKRLTPLGDIGEWAWFLGFFGAGMVLHFLRDRLVFDGRGALVALLALLVFVELGQFIMLFPLAGACLAIWFARRYDPWLDYSRYCGDLSYGVYIYGWPAEQLVMYLSGGRAAWWQVFLGSLLIALPLAWLSWHGVEKWALRGGRALARRPLTVAPAPADG
ncbi:MAG TPA: acyltransferase [Stellaceae bacterium]